MCQEYFEVNKNNMKNRIVLIQKSKTYVNIRICMKQHGLRLLKRLYLRIPKQMQYLQGINRIFIENCMIR